MLAVSKKLIRTFLWVLIKPLLVFFKIITKYKVVIWRVDRLGHLALNTHLFLIRRKLRGDKRKFLILSPSKNNKSIANKTLWGMFLILFKSELNIKTMCSTSIYHVADFFKYELRLIGLSSPMRMDSKEKEFLLGVETVTFNREQQKYGDRLIDSMPIPKNKEIVTIFARDSSFLDNYFPEIDWSYHSYRDCDIVTYIDAIKFLIERGYVVIRIGSEFSKTLDLQHENFFEYSLSDFKSSFLDLYLVYKSKFVIGSTSGATDIAVVFNVPFLGVNYAPFVESPLGKNDLFIQKKLTDNKHIIPFKDIVSDERYYSYNGNEMKSKYGLSYIDNTNEEILNATKEMHDKIASNRQFNREQENLIQRYQNDYCRKNKWSSRPAPISLGWLKDNQNLYLQE